MTNNVQNTEKMAKSMRAVEARAEGQRKKVDRAIRVALDFGMHPDYIKHRVNRCLMQSGKVSMRAINMELTT